MSALRKTAFIYGSVVVAISGAISARGLPDAVNLFLFGHGVLNGPVRGATPWAAGQRCVWS